MTGALLLVLIALATGCASPHARSAAHARPFTFGQDSLAWDNELKWAYDIEDTTGQMQMRRREPPPEFSLHCFSVARAARQFLYYARFDPDQPRADDDAYRQLIRKVMRTNPRRAPATAKKRIVIPGFANLREFSAAHEYLLKDQCGGGWRSYFQRGHWRMVFPFSRRNQEKAAQRLLDAIRQNRPPVLHIVRFPALTINHAVLVFDADEGLAATRFQAYDPNNSSEPITITFDRATRTFTFPRTPYFPGGRIDAYEVYHSCLY